MSSYIALIRKDADCDFGVTFPDFPGCVTAGSMLDEARAMAEKALGLHIEGLIEDGEALPSLRDLETVMANPEARDAVVFLFSVPEELARAHDDRKL